MHVAPHKASLFWKEALRFSKAFRFHRHKKSPIKQRSTGMKKERRRSTWRKEDVAGSFVAPPEVRNCDLLEIHVRDRLDSMFSAHTFEWGVEMAHFLEATMRLTSLPEVELWMLLDGFEGRWNLFNKRALWTVRTITNRVQTFWSWVKQNEDGLLEDPIERQQDEARSNWGEKSESSSEEEMYASQALSHAQSGLAKKLIKKKKAKTSRAKLSWARMVMLLQCGFPGESSAAHRPTFGEAAKLLRKREEYRTKDLRLEFDKVRKEYDKMKDRRLRAEAEVARLRTLIGPRAMAVAAAGPRATVVVHGVSPASPV